MMMPLELYVRDRSNTIGLHVKEEPKVLHMVYLDTTYAKSRIVFPSQEHVLASLASEVHRITVSENRQKLIPLSYLIVVGTYTIGKERVCEHLATLLATRLWTASPRKRAILELLFPPELLSDDPLTARVHVVDMMALTSDEALGAMLDRFRPHYTHIIAVRATGWTVGAAFAAGAAFLAKPPTESKLVTKPPIPIMEGKPKATLKTLIGGNLNAIHALIKEEQEIVSENAAQQIQNHLIQPAAVAVVTKKREQPSKGRISSLVKRSARKGTLPRHKGRITLLEVPYSEHSSFEELQYFLAAFRIDTVIPTVEDG